MAGVVQAILLSVFFREENLRGRGWDFSANSREEVEAMSGPSTKDHASVALFRVNLEKHNPQGYRMLEHDIIVLSEGEIESQ